MNNRENLFATRRVDLGFNLGREFGSGFSGERSAVKNDARNVGSGTARMPQLLGSPIFRVLLTQAHPNFYLIPSLRHFFWEGVCPIHRSRGAQIKNTSLRYCSPRRDFLSDRSDVRGGHGFEPRIRTCKRKFP